MLVLVTVPGTMTNMVKKQGELFTDDRKKGY